MHKNKVELDHKTILVTGSPGFIGSNLVIMLLKKLKGGTVISFDSMNDYYDPKLKEYRLSEGGIDVQEFPGRLLRLDHAIAYAEPPSS